MIGLFLLLMGFMFMAFFLVKAIVYTLPVLFAIVLIILYGGFAVAVLSCLTMLL